MMVIRRKCGQAFHIGDHVQITVLEVQQGSHVRFGIEAPAEIPVHRLEIYQRIQTENLSSSNGDALCWLKGVAP
ncbi:MAG: carbon storage regulator CsrA [Mariprofundaceae bacterium]|nr:carbon storage regulator CsrA [Mariprofundaceae bacterium]